MRKTQAEKELERIKRRMDGAQAVKAVLATADIGKWQILLHTPETPVSSEHWLWVTPTGIVTELFSEEHEGWTSFANTADREVTIV